MDQHENLIVYHPKCEFCDKRLYDLEALKLHIKQNHYQCEVCRQDKPYMVYKDLNQMRLHYEASHFPCKEPECMEMIVIFASEKELEYHKDKTHRKGANKGRFDAGTLLGVRIHDDEDDDDGYLLENRSRPMRGGRGGRGGFSGSGRDQQGDKIGKDFTTIVGVTYLVQKGRTRSES